MSTYLRENQITELRAEKDGLLRMLGDPASQLQERGSMNQMVRNIDKQIEKNAPPEIKVEELDALVQEESELREQLLRGMPSCEEMRKAPAGAVGKHQAWEARAKEVINPQGEKRLDRWKNIMLRLNRGNSDPDISNFERFRPKVSTLGMHDTLISDSATRSYPSEAYKQGWDGMEGHTSPAQLETLQAEIAELRKLVKQQTAAPKAPKSLRSAKAPNGKSVKRIVVHAACGKQLRPLQNHASRSIKAHERQCADCKEAVKK